MYVHALILLMLYADSAVTVNVTGNANVVDHALLLAQFDANVKLV